jgi:hypothetical protein
MALMLRDCKNKVVTQIQCQKKRPVFQRNNALLGPVVKKDGDKKFTLVTKFAHATLWNLLWPFSGNSIVEGIRRALEPVARLSFLDFRRRFCLCSMSPARQGLTQEMLKSCRGKV